jgi:hypothetical protein
MPHLEGFSAQLRSNINYAIYCYKWIVLGEVNTKFDLIATQIAINNADY